MKNATIDIIAEISNNHLKVNYECQTNHVLFSIADFGGNVVKRGDCASIVDQKIPIESLSKGMYVLCIIDGGELIKTRFEII
ncbi:MAG: hypothetical protein JNL69_12005 [Bacteroidia bacterium]|nr:hypothetical protein [Bacteroidia bacterium]